MRVAHQRISHNTLFPETKPEKSMKLKLVDNFWPLEMERTQEIVVFSRQTLLVLNPGNKKIISVRGMIEPNVPPMWQLCNWMLPAKSSFFALFSLDKIWGFWLFGISGSLMLKRHSNSDKSGFLQWWKAAQVALRYFLILWSSRHCCSYRERLCRIQ